MQYELKTYNYFEGAAEAFWKKLELSRNCYVFQRFDWLKHWQETIGVVDGVEPLIIVVFENKEPIALFPLCLECFFGIKIVKFLGGDQSDYNAPIYAPDRVTPQVFMKIWKAVLELLPTHDVRYFVRIPEYLDATKTSILFEIAGKTIDGIAYFSNLDPSWKDFERNISRKLLKDNARMKRRLSEIGDVEILVSKSEEQYQKIIEVTIFQKMRRYTETGVRNILSYSSARQFYTGLNAAISGESKVHLTAIKVDDRILATHLGVFDHARYYYLFPTFDSGPLSKYSPGRLLLEYLVKSAVEKRICIFDFTVGGEDYKQKWCDSQMRLYRIIEAKTPQGKIYMWLQNLVFWVKKNHYTRYFFLGVMKLARSNRGYFGK